MKVLVLPSWYPSKSYPNNGSFFKEQAEALKNSGIDVTVLCIDIPYRNEKKDFMYFRKNSYKENGIQVYRYVFPLGILHRFPKLYYKFLKLISKYICKREFKGEKYDAIHAHSFLIGGYAGICMKEYYGCKCIITEHTSKILTGRLNKTEKEVLAKCINGSDRFICVSQNLKKCVQEITGSKKRIDVYPNLVNQIFQYENKQESPFIFTSIGNLIPLKRMDLLIESFCESFSEKENVRLEIYGSGVEYEKLRKIIINKRREKQIILHGSVSREEIAVSLKKSHVMALISEKETFGVAYVEALASGNVVIGANNGGANDIISDENGMIVNSSEIRDVSEVLRKAYETYLQYNPEEISKKCIEKYGERAFGNIYKKLFQEEIQE